MIEENKLYCGDCREILKEIPDGMIDLILTDPPYNVSKSGNDIVRNGGKFGNTQAIKLDFGEWDHDQISPEDYLDEFARVLKPCGVLVMFYNYLYLGQIGIYLQDNFGFQIRHIGAWVKSNPSPQARKVKWENGMEQFLIATKNKGAGHHFNYKLGQSPDYCITLVKERRECILRSSGRS